MGILNIGLIIVVFLLLCVVGWLTFELTRTQRREKQAAKALPSIIEKVRATTRTTQRASLSGDVLQRYCPSFLV